LLRISSIVPPGWWRDSGAMREIYTFGGIFHILRLRSIARIRRGTSWVALGSGRLP
jgi:hypothetical protein